MVDILMAVLLGLIQGLTEFFPVSSSAHLNIFPWLFNYDMPEGFDFALHAGTLLAILVYFFKDWLKLIVGGWDAAVHKKKSVDGRLFWFLVFATIPAGLIGALLEKLVDDVIVKENIGLEMGLIAFALIAMGIVLYIVDKRSSTSLSLDKLKFKPAFIIGLSQAIAAALPGVSRSGVTMTFARGYGLDRESAARYSFLLSAPIVAGGMLVNIVKGDFAFTIPAILGILFSFISGFAVVKFFMKLLKKISFRGFAIYRIALGILIFIILIFK